MLTQAAGTWDYTPGAGDPLVTGYATRGATGFNIFANSGDPLSGEWVSSPNRLGGPSVLRHMAFFGIPAPVLSATAPVPVPAPAAALLLATGLAGLAGLARRRRRPATRAASAQGRQQG